MLLKSLTFSSGTSIESDIPKCPFVEVTSERDLFNKMLNYKQRPAEAQIRIEKQYAWAKEYTNPELVAKRILEI